MTSALDEDVVVTVFSAKEEHYCNIVDLFVEQVIALKIELLTSSNVNNFGSVKIDNKSHADIVEIGDITLQTDV